MKSIFQKIYNDFIYDKGMNENDGQTVSELFYDDIDDDDLIELIKLCEEELQQRASDSF